MRITFISDTHGQHEALTNLLPGGDLLIHAGDFTNNGTKDEYREFASWWNAVPNYNKCIGIAGNHDISPISIFEPFRLARAIYLENEYCHLKGWSRPLDGEKSGYFLGVYGSPYTPAFWGDFQAERGPQIKAVWDKIPDYIDILITHGPAFGVLDYDAQSPEGHLGCQDLKEAIERVRPKIHVCGHIHSGYGYCFNGHTHFINASILDNQNRLANHPITVDWIPETNELTFIDAPKPIVGK